MGTRDLPARHRGIEIGSLRKMDELVLSIEVAAGRVTRD